MTKYLFLALFTMASAAWASEEAVERSSHPRGIAVGGALPQMTAPTGSRPLAGSGVLESTSATQDKPVQGGHQATTGGVAVTGATRIDARVQSGTATAVGDQNTAGNRVGSIGGK